MSDGFGIFRLESDFGKPSVHNYDSHFGAFVGPLCGPMYIPRGVLSNYSTFGEWMKKGTRKGLEET
jgi:hypothetical protein